MAKTIEAMFIAFIFGSLCVSSIMYFLADFTSPTTYAASFGSSGIDTNMQAISGNLTGDTTNATFLMRNQMQNQTVVVAGVDASQLVNNAFGQLLMVGFQSIQVLFKVPDMILNLFGLIGAATTAVPLPLMILGGTLTGVIAVVVVFQLVKAVMHSEV